MPLAGNRAALVFVVGMPRSGTTLLERILTGLSNVRSNGERYHFRHAMGFAVVGVSQGALVSDRGPVVSQR